MRILGLSGSLRRDSHNTQLLRAAAELLPAGVDFFIHDGIREIPPYDADLSHTPGPEPVERLRAAVREADAVLIATPEYNHSIPGALKNALDWLSRPLASSPLQGKPTLVIGGSTGMFGAVWAQAEARKVVAAIGAHVLDRELPIPNIDEQFDFHGHLIEESLAQMLSELLDELTEATTPRSTAAA
ncbi:MAG TPA: NADPH-dependent FMN reductase [Solirubrobacteraceae bacterium]|jgi:chromate reductase|nr:NADPH-dependent FMN reductase [Solirubrobacteraceae bacterium]